MRVGYRQISSVWRVASLGIAAVVLCIAFCGCEFEVPITPSPTGKVNEQLLGDWVSKDGKEKMKVRRLDDQVYIVSYNGDLFRAFHSEVAKTPFVSVQDIDSDGRKYTYLTWRLMEGGKQLGLRAVSHEVVPKDVKTSAAIQKLLEEQIKNPALLGEEGLFTKFLEN